MGAIADAIATYAQPLIEATDGSLEQMNKALAISQLCWNVSLAPEEVRRQTFDNLRESLGLSETEFAKLERDVLRPMIRRHWKMFPGLHPDRLFSSPDSGSTLAPPSIKSFAEKLFASVPASAASEQSPVADDGEVNVDRLLEDLDDAYTFFPEDTLQACQQHRELVIPRLIAVLREAVEMGKDGTEREGNAPFFTMYLLAEFQASEALPAIIDFLSLPNDLPETLLGEAITEVLPRILAIFTAERLDVLDGLIRDPRLNDFVRWAAVDAFDYFVRDGRLSRAEAVRRLASHLLAATASDDRRIINSLVEAVIDLGAVEARADIQAVFERGLLDGDYPTMESVDERLRLAAAELAQHLDRLPPTKIEDTVEELRNWHWPDEDWAGESWEDDELSGDEWDGPILDGGRMDDDGPGDAEWNDNDAYEPPYPAATVRHESPRVGRNDPCPCGSGKKYKKCCLRNMPPE